MVFLLTVHHCDVTPLLSLVPAYPTILPEKRKCLDMRLTAPICARGGRYGEKIGCVRERATSTLTQLMPRQLRPSRVLLQLHAFNRQ